MSEVKKCPKCGNVLNKANNLRLADKWIGFLAVTAYVCGNCGYVEFYREKLPCHISRAVLSASLSNAGR
jgi:predicted nucleic-acid-binding Zn-ribbon protein